MNAKVVLGNIVIGEPLLEVHGKYPQEIIAILTHEFGHQNESHLYKQIVVDTLYMMIYGLVMVYFINRPSFLMSMGFP